MNVSIVGIPWYKREDYDALIKLFSDGDKLPGSYEEWLKKAEDVADQLRRARKTVVKAHIDPDGFRAWCAARGSDIDAQARRDFANEAAAMAHND